MPAKERTEAKKYPSPFKPLGGGVEAMEAGYGVVVRAGGAMVYVPDSHLMPKNDHIYSVMKR